MVERISLYEQVVLLVVLPILDWCRHSYWLTALPLHFLDQGWDIMHLSFLDLGSAILRMLLAAVISRAGDWPAVVADFLTVAASIPSAFSPSSRTAVYVGVVGSNTSFTPQVQRTLIFQKYAADVVGYRRALRIITVCEVIGYSLGSALAGLLYEFTGWRGCACLQSGISFGQGALLLSLPAFWESCGRRNPSKQLETPSVEASEQEQAAHPENRVGIEQGVSSAGPAASKKHACKFFVPVALLLIAEMTNIMAYAFEWKIFALYFSDIYAWPAVYIGLGQAAGDLLAALLLIWLALRGTVHTSALLAFAGRFTQMPFNVSALFLIQTCVCISFVLPYFELAVAGQVLIGTVYVLATEALQETLAVYGKNNAPLYRQITFLHNLMYNIATLVAAAAGVPLYAVDSRLPMLVAACILFPAGLVFTIYFSCKLSQLPAGIFGGLGALEAQLEATH